jgi:hypothetical protein
MGPLSAVQQQAMYQVKVARIAMDMMKSIGEQTVALIQNSPPPVGLQGQGSVVNTYA